MLFSLQRDNKKYTLKLPSSNKYIASQHIDFIQLHDGIAPDLNKHLLCDTPFTDQAVQGLESLLDLLHQGVLLLLIDLFDLALATLGLFLKVQLHWERH